MPEDKLVLETDCPTWHQCLFGETLRQPHDPLHCRSCRTGTRHGHPDDSGTDLPERRSFIWNSGGGGESPLTLPRGGSPLTLRPNLNCEKGNVTAGGESPLTLRPNFNCEKGSVTADKPPVCPPGDFVGGNKASLKGRGTSEAGGGVLVDFLELQISQQNPLVRRSLVGAMPTSSRLCQKSPALQG